MNLSKVVGVGNEFTSIITNILNKQTESNWVYSDIFKVFSHWNYLFKRDNTIKQDVLRQIICYFYNYFILEKVIKSKNNKSLKSEIPNQIWWLFNFLLKTFFFKIIRIRDFNFPICLIQQLRFLLMWNYFY